MRLARSLALTSPRLLRPQLFSIKTYPRCFHQSKKLRAGNLIGADNVSKTRNIGIIAHIDAGKTTTTERMLYYSGYTTRIGDVDDGSTVTDFLPAERARGITIQSAAITLHWPPKSSTSSEKVLPGQPLSSISHDINLIDTPGHADFTFEVLRSLRVLDGAVCILDGVAGVEAQTEIVWSQASNYGIPKLIYINKLDRTGAEFSRTVQEIALKLRVWPAVCHIPWWQGSNRQFCGIGDAINLRALEWEEGSDGRSIKVKTLAELQESDAVFATEITKARIALVELLSEHDDIMVEQFLENDENHLAIAPLALIESLRRCTLQQPQAVAPVFAGASFRNIGIQPLMDSVVDMLPSPSETSDSDISMSGIQTKLRPFLEGKVQLQSSLSSRRAATKISLTNIQACALAFKVVNDAKRGVLVYVRVYSGALQQGSALFNTTLGVGERAYKLMRMYASDAVDLKEIEAGHIGVIAGLKHTRTGDTLICYSGMNSKTGPPAPVNSLQLKPITIPPPVFFASIEPQSLAEEKAVSNALDILLREDPSLHVSTDPESGQTHLSGMGELHLEIACDRLIKDFKAKATVGKIEIGYRETITESSGESRITIDREIGGKATHAVSVSSVEPRDVNDRVDQMHISQEDDTTTILLQDNNILTVHHPAFDSSGSAINAQDASLPPGLSFKSILVAIQAGVAAALARGPKYALPVHSANVNMQLSPKDHISTDTTTGAIALASRKSVQAALKAACDKRDSTLLEPVMLATITVHEGDLGSVVHDITAARGGQVLSLGEDDAAMSTTGERLDQREECVIDLKKVYTPPDPFTSGAAQISSDNAAQIRRQIIARVPLKEMVGYLKHLRSLTGGRGTFLMQVDRFEPVRGQRLKKTVNEIRGL
ncbi:mitochondrial translation elongation factor-like protein G [Microthyrium microscopicum]|uniref:Ribosome-releasing factor 2, mitochondrial n=1 Tax=Microthyrium microscopicum TaxID=703497 RepID=A0A6A6USL7_9PEZI|nr:mitochondrial translation elongation factor-like protein G [Microthyrium microscopicum]